jgi:hypothetical protein
MVNFEGNAIDPFVEYGKGVENMWIDEELNYLSRLHTQINYI